VLKKLVPNPALRFRIEGNRLPHSRLWRKGGFMLATRSRFQRNPYFQFHPLHGVFSLVGALILLGLLVWFLAVPAR
jgi:hypothetical protein